MENIAELLKARLEASRNNTLPERLKTDAKEYNKKWAKAVQFFQKEINRERLVTKSSYPQLSFIAVRQLVQHITEIEDLRWFWNTCIKYRKSKKENTFGRCFFGALQIKE